MSFPSTAGGVFHGDLQALVSWVSSATWVSTITIVRSKFQERVGVRVRSGMESREKWAIEEGVGVRVYEGEVGAEQAVGV